MPRNRQILLARRPLGAVRLEDFQLVTGDTPAPAEGQVLVRHRWLSLDPYMRGRMDDVPSYALPQPLGEVMLGATVAEVVESRHPRWASGDTVLGMGGWQEWSVVAGDAPGLRQVDATRVPASTYLGALGMPGVTAWWGLTRLVAAQPGQAVTVSAASGAVGSVVGVLAKARGLRVVGIAGGPEKCGYVTGELGFDACIDHRAHPDARSLAAALAQGCPGGIAGHFENVGGRVLDAVLSCIQPHGRIALCGMIAGYDGRPVPLAQPQLILSKRLRVEGFVISEHPEAWSEALPELHALVARGKLRPRETVAHGIEAAPEAFLGLLQGRNFGKQLVQLD
ncbi:NADP-dependent oxidoreductase [Ramlibacter sp. AW1]|uniref:NADP-dependent oxidoreductase n=1 Tax=Ramlibacter aurantiacus TaxID=2801330 RepID=A0A937CZW9_9BURK|nr:NADP-dependent oxidoreductase [Ramlibacter aurantiacus]MBL0418804.1 NADP-dependent oxidoreductase [Ramlibacter aurantiacus]